MSRLRRWLYDEEATSARLIVATTAMRCAPDAAENRKHIAQITEQILRERQDVQLVMFGEMMLGWYDPSQMVEASEPIPGPTTAVLQELAREHGVFLCCGISERTERGCHNAQVLINPQGNIQALHRKWNLKSFEREAGYLPGPTPVTTTVINGVKTALIICADAAHPHTMRDLMRSDVDLILLSLADDRDEMWFMAKANARLYDAWIVSANRYGEEHHAWSGHTVVSDPLGRLRQVLVDQEGYLVATVRIAQDRSRFVTWVRNLAVKAPLPLHMARHWRILRSYYQ